MRIMRRSTNKTNEKKNKNNTHGERKFSCELLLYERVRVRSASIHMRPSNCEQLRPPFKTTV